MYIYYWYNRITKQWQSGETTRFTNLVGVYPSECRMMIPGTVDPRD